MISLTKTLKAIKKALEKLEYETLLWTNSSPESSFNPTSLNISGDYDEYIIEWNDYVGESSRSILRMKKGETIRFCSAVIGASGNNFWANMREVSSSGSGSSHRLVFGGGFYKSQGNTSLAASNVAQVPIRIYGVRKLGGK